MNTFTSNIFQFIHSSLEEKAKTKDESKFSFLGLQ